MALTQNEMPETKSPDAQDVLIFTRAVESVFRKLIRFLVGRMSLTHIQDLIRAIYLQEAEKNLQAEDAADGIPLSSLAVLTGLDTRTINKIRQSQAFNELKEKREFQLRELSPCSAVLDAWSSNDEYYDKQNGTSREIMISGPSPSFEALFAEAVKSRGITAASILDRLVESGCVVVNRDNRTVSLVSEVYLPGYTKDQIGVIEMGFAAISSLLNTVFHNFEARGDDWRKQFQRSTWTNHLAREHRDEMKKQLEALLKDTNQVARDCIVAHEQKHAGKDELTVGVGFFYFEEENRERSELIDR